MPNKEYHSKNYSNNFNYFVLVACIKNRGLLYTMPLNKEEYIFNHLFFSFQPSGTGWRYFIYAKIHKDDSLRKCRQSLCLRECLIDNISSTSFVFMFAFTFTLRFSCSFMFTIALVFMFIFLSLYMVLFKFIIMVTFIFKFTINFMLKFIFLCLFLYFYSLLLPFSFGRALTVCLSLRYIIYSVISLYLIYKLGHNYCIPLYNDLKLGTTVENHI